MLFWAADLVVLPYKRIYQSGVLLTALSYGKPSSHPTFHPLLKSLKTDPTGCFSKLITQNRLRQCLLRR